MEFLRNLFKKKEAKQIHWEAPKDSDSQTTAGPGKSPEETKEQSSVGALIAALRNNDPDVHAMAAELLGEIGDARAVEPLIAALEDPNFLGRLDAWNALGKFDDSRARKAVKAHIGSMPLRLKVGPDDPEAKKRGEERVKKLRDTLTAVCTEFTPKEARRLLETHSFKELRNLIEANDSPKAPTTSLSATCSREDYLGMSREERNRFASQFYSILESSPDTDFGYQSFPELRYDEMVFSTLFADLLQSGHLVSAGRERFRLAPK